MEERMCKVTVDDKVIEYKEGTKYQTIARDFQKYYDHQIVLAVIGDNRLQELSKAVEEDVKLSFITTADKAGFETYKRSMCFLLVKAVHDIGGHDKVERIRIHFSVSKGYYCTVDGEITINDEFLTRVDARMHEMAEQKIQIKKKAIPTSKAIELFHKHKMYDKEQLFEYRRVSTVNIYSINEFEDYYYGYMVPDTGYLRNFSLHLYGKGFVIQFPTISDPAYVPKFEPREKLFKVQNESIEWGDLQGIDTVGALNDMITKHDMREIVLV